MPRFDIWIRKENESRWSEIRDKSAWINSMIASLETGEPGVPPATKPATNPYIEAMASRVKLPTVIKTGFKPCKHGADPKFCKFAKSGKPCK